MIEQVNGNKVCKYYYLTLITEERDQKAWFKPIDSILYRANGSITEDPSDAVEAKLIGNMLMTEKKERIGLPINIGWEIHHNISYSYNDLDLRVQTTENRKRRASVRKIQKENCKFPTLPRTVEVYSTDHAVWIQTWGEYKIWLETYILKNL
jgi:hypothetical protein